MPSLLRILTHPESRRPGPPPLEVNLRVVVLVGLAGWVIASVVFGVLTATGVTEWTTLAVCGAGVVLGGLGLLWARGLQR